jgi:hypothetical protein
MAIRDADLWHQVHAQREDGVPATFLIREVDPRPDQPQIFVIQMPYPTTDLSTLPDAESIRRLDTFQEQWVEPACEALGWTLVAWKSEDGAFFLYLYGDGDPDALLEKLARYDGDLGFFHDRDADWSEYAALRELVEQAQAAPDEGGADTEGGEGGEDDHVHTAACDHDHDHDHDATSHGIAVIDLTGDPPAGEAEPTRPAATKSRAAKPPRARAPGVQAKKAKAAKAAPAKPAAAKTRATKAARTRPAKAKAASTQRAPSKATQRPPSKATQRPPSKATQRAPSKATQRAPSKATQRAAKPASSKTPARRPVAGKRPAPRTSRR